MPPCEVLQTVMDQYLAAYEAHDSVACADFYTENGVIISPFGPPCVGRPAIEAEHSAWFEDGETNKTLTVLQASISGSTGFCLVSYSADVPSDAGVKRVYGASLNALEKDAAGTWLLRHTSLNELEHDLMQDLI